MVKASSQSRSRSPIPSAVQQSSVFHWWSDHGRWPIEHPWKPVMIVTFVGMVVRALLFQSPLHVDELDFISFHYPNGWWFTCSDYYSANNHIAYNLLVHCPAAVFGLELWVVRLPAFVCGCLLIPATAWCATLWGGRRVGLFAAMLIAIGPLFINYSIYARGYSLLLLLMVLSTIQLQSLIRHPSGRSAVALGILWSLAAWTIPIAIQPVSFLLLWALIRCSRMPKTVRKVAVQHLMIAAVLTVGLTLLLYSPVLIGNWRSLFSDRATFPVAWNRLPSQAVEQLRDAAWMFSRDYGQIGWVAPLTLAVIGLFAARRRQRDIALLALCALVGQVAWMMVQRVLPFPRVMLPLWWTWVMVAGVGMAQLESWLPLTRRGLTMISLVGMSVAAVILLESRQSAGINGYWPHDFHLIAQALQDGRPPKQLFTNYADMGLIYYFHRLQVEDQVNRYTGPGQHLFLCRKTPEGLDLVTRTQVGLEPLIEIWMASGGPPVTQQQFQKLFETRYYDMYRLNPIRQSPN